MSVQVEMFRRFIGKPAKDIYGRYVGYVVGITLDAGGRLRSIGVDRGGIFEEFTRTQIMLDNETLILVPRWKVEAEKFKKEYGLTHSRFQALDELLKNGEIPEYVYKELYEEYKSSMSKLEEAQKSLIETLTKKMEELDNHAKHLEKFLGYLKVQHKTGEMSDETYKMASEQLITGIEKTLQEKEDIEKSLKSLTSPGDELPSMDVPPTVKPSDETEKPIIVHLQTD